LGGSKTCVEVSTWDNRVWIELYLGGWSEARGLFRCILGRQQCGQGRAHPIVVSTWVQGLFPWFNRKQKSVALSFAEVEYMATNLASCEAIWIRKLLMGLFDQVLDTIVIHCDKQSCIKVYENPVFHDRSKHIEIRYHFIRDCMHKGSVKLQYVPTGEQDCRHTHKVFGERKVCLFQG
jgi:hypothetical protein